MSRPNCKVVAESQRYGSIAVRSIRYDGDELTIDVQGEAFSFARILFDEPLGFRVLSEGDLCEFWNEYSSPNGWLYEVLNGGWLEMESKREGFNSTPMYPDAKEFFLVDESCVNVIATDEPKIIDVGGDPIRR